MQGYSKRFIRRAGRLVHDALGDPILRRVLIPGAGSGGGSGSENGGVPFTTGRRPGWMVKLNLSTTVTTHNLTAAGASGAATDAQFGGHAYIEYSGTGAAQGWATSAVFTNMALSPTYYATMRTGGDVTQNAYQYGFHNTNFNAATTLPSRSICFFAPASAGAQNWLAYTSNNTAGGVNGNVAVGNTTSFDTGVALTADTRYVFFIRVNSTTSVDFYINGTFITNITTTLPDAQDLQLRLFAFSVAANTRVIRNQLVYITTG